MGFVIQEKSYENEHVHVNTERTIMSSSSSFGILREKLVQNIGIKRIGAFLFHYGYDMGVNNAKQAMEREKSIEQLIKDGPKWHVKSGQIRDFEHKCNVEYGADGQVVSVVGQGKWIGSYEAYEHKKRIGQADAPVCHTLLGYSSGFMSTIFGRELLARELTCTGAGDAECRWVIKLKEDWHQDMHDDIYQENHSPILQELEFTYDQLLDQTQLVTKLSSFQKRLTQEIVDGSDLQSVTNRAYEILRVPIIIDDLNLDSLSFAGVSEERIKSINEESKRKLPEHVVKNRKKYAVPYRKKVMELSKGYRYIVPILVENEILGYCSTLITSNDESHSHEHYFFVEHLANAVALILLNEKTRFDSNERMKGSFFEQILERKYSDTEFINKGKYIGLNLNTSFHIAVIDYQTAMESVEEEFAFNEHIMESTAHFFNKERVSVLTALREGKVTIYVSGLSDKQAEKVLGSFYRKLEDDYPNTNMKMGISQLGEEVGQILDRYKEATLALRLAIKKPIVSYGDLGIVGVLLNTEQMEGIQMVMRQELGGLDRLKLEKRNELLKTLYFFLENGGNLEQTKQDLALSMSGLRHRIVKIEELLGKDLRQPKEAHQLFLMLQIMVVLKELELN